MRGYALLAVLGRHRQDCSSPGAPASASLGTVVAEGRASNTIDTVFQVKSAITRFAFCASQ